MWMNIIVKRAIWTAVLVGGLSIFTLACRLVQGLPSPQPEQTPTTLPAASPDALATSDLESPEGWELTATALVYPGPEQNLPPQPPAGGPLVTVSSTAEQPFGGDSNAAMTATALVYPGPEAFPPMFPVPSMDSNTATVSPESYPLPELPQLTDLATATLPPTAVFFPTDTVFFPTDTPLATFPAYPFGELATPTTGFTLTPQEPQVTVTPTSSPTPFVLQTPTPSPMPTPTASATPLPLPPWLAANITATDPASFRLASGKVQLVEFFAYWSGICLAMAPTIHNLQDRYGAEVNFIFLDIDNPAVKPFQELLGFRLEPHFFLLDANGNLLQQWVGYVSYQTLAEALDAALRRP